MGSTPSSVTMGKQKDTEPNEDSKYRKSKKLSFNNSVRCYHAKCATKIMLNDDMDPDLELAKHMKAAHDIPYPDWVDTVWDSMDSRSNKHKKSHWKN